MLEEKLVVARRQIQEKKKQLQSTRSVKMILILPSVLDSREIRVFDTRSLLNQRLSSQVIKSVVYWFGHSDSLQQLCDNLSVTVSQLLKRQVPCTIARIGEVASSERDGFGFVLEVRGFVIGFGTSI